MMLAEQIIRTIRNLKVMSVTALCATGCLLLAACGGGGASSSAALVTSAAMVDPAYFNGQIWFENGSAKIRQDVTVKSQASFAIKSAKNEFEPFQLVIKNTGASTLSTVDVSISDFTGSPGTIANSNVTIFKEEYLNITNLSTTEGQAGEWPDALLPKVDAYYHETRSTFPFDVAAGRVQPIWFDVFVPANTTAGDYSATVTVTANGETIFTGTVTLTVWNFTLPATSSLPSFFSASPDHFWKGFSGAEWIPTADMVVYQRDFIKAGLRHRISLSPYYIQWGAWNGTNYASIDVTKFNQSLAGFVDGTASGIEYGAARITGLTDDFSSVYKRNVVNAGLCSSLTEPPTTLLYETQKRAELLAATLTAEQLATTYYLVIDEPGGGEVGCGATNPDLDYKSVKAMAQIMHTYGLKTRQTSTRKTELLNTANTPATNDYIDRWSPFFGLVVGRDWSGNFFDKTGDYAADIAAGTQLWWYQSCMSGGCGITGGSSYNGNPHYFIEYSAMHTRIFPWMSYKYGIMGESYWSVGMGFGVGAGYIGDPYYSLWSSNYKKNADGAFFYPGVVNTAAAGLPATDGRGAHTPSIGGTHNVPIESIRLKMIREGREDYEYLKMLTDRGDDAYAQALAGLLVTTTYNFVSDESQLYMVREQLASRITSLTVGP